MTLTPPRERVPRHAAPTDDDGEAQRRYDATENNDPFPDIAPALLNSSDITDYARQTGMICPFSQTRLKSASYAVRIGRQLVYWTAAGELAEKYLLDGEHFSISPNSIIFVTTEEKFRLPNYIAVRFNLHIEMVHRGLLLGTGPLVDPGFCGHLLIPLHNLTNNEYTLAQGQELIWIEFTKTSHNAEWNNTCADIDKGYELSGHYIPFPERKRNKDIWYYLNKARADIADGPVCHLSIRSSIPIEIRKAQEEAGSAERSATSARNDARRAAEHMGGVLRWVSIGTIVGVVTVMIGIATVVYQGYQLVSQAVLASAELEAEVEAVRKEMAIGSEREAMLRPLTSVEGDMRALEERVDKLEVEMRALSEGNGAR